MNKFRLLKENISCLRINIKLLFLIFYLFLFLFSLAACVSHLKEAKYYYTQGQRFSRLYQTEDAIASYKSALREAELEVKKNPSAQGYMLKGMAELNLELWEQAEKSFLNAFSYGFEKGEEWAQQLSLFGLASSLEALGLGDTALKIYFYLLNKSKLRAVTVSAAQKYTDGILKRALQKKAKEKQKLLVAAFKVIEKLTNKDLSCGFYHYLQSQIYSHLSDYQKSFEEALMAKELGLPTLEIFRDNDLQIVFCYQQLKEKLSVEKWDKFLYQYMKWVKRWGWKNPVTPGWKKEAKHAPIN